MALSDLFGGGKDKTNSRLRKADKLFRDLKLPGISDQRLSLEELQYLGDLSPELAETMSLDPSAYENISIDPRLKTAQMQALEQISQASKEGLTPADVAQME